MRPYSVDTLFSTNSNRSPNLLVTRKSVPGLTALEITLDTCSQLRLPN